MNADNTPPTETASSATQATSTFVLPDNLTVAQANALRDALLERIDCDELLLDGSAVETVGTAGLQVLAALVKSRDAKSVRWKITSLALMNAAQLADLCPALCLPPETEVAA